MYFPFILFFTLSRIKQNPNLATNILKEKNNNVVVFSFSIVFFLCLRCNFFDDEFPSNSDEDFIIIIIFFFCYGISSTSSGGFFTVIITTYSHFTFFSFGSESVNSACTKMEATGFSDFEEELLLSTITIVIANSHFNCISFGNGC